MLHLSVLLLLISFNTFSSLRSGFTPWTDKLTWTWIKTLVIYTDMILDILGLVKKHRDMAEETEDDTEQSGDDTFSYQSGGK